MTIEEIEQEQFFLSESRTSHPERKEAIRKAMSRWAASCPGVIPVSTSFNTGR